MRRSARLPLARNPSWLWCRQWLPKLGLRFSGGAGLLTFLVLLLIQPGQSQAAADHTARASIVTNESAIRAAFTNPPSAFRILKIIHNWPDDPAAQDRLIQRLSKQGFGGVVCNVSFDDYLRDEKHWQAFERAVRRAREAGWTLWLYDEQGYPSGVAGGLVLKDHPEWEAEGLLISDTVTRGAPASLRRPPGRLLLAAAFPVESGRLQLERRVELRAELREEQLQWKPPGGQGTWHVMIITRDRLYAGTHAEMNLFKKQPYPNPLRPEPTRRFIELTHEAYARRLGNDLGKFFVSTFTDEPSLMSLFIRRMPWRVLPWSDQLGERAQERTGWPLDALLPWLVAGNSADARRTRYVFWQTVAELVSENYFGQIQRWCARHHLASGGHLLMEEDLPAHVALYGDLFRCLRRLDAPSIDCLTSVPEQVPWFIGRVAASAAALEGKELVMCETSDHSQRYRPPGDKRPRRQVSEAEIRGTCNRLMVAGVNVITSYYSFAGLDDAALQRLNEWVGRCAALLRGSTPRPAVAVLYPIESLWPVFQPATHRAHASPEALRIERSWRGILEALFAARREFTVIDSRTLVEGRVEDGALVYRGLRWPVVVLPAVDTLPEKAWRTLRTLAESGGVVVSAGARPAHCAEHFPCPQAEVVARAVFSGGTGEVHVRELDGGGLGITLPWGAESLLPALLNAARPPALRVREAEAPLRMTHRQALDHELYFLINDSGQPWSGTISWDKRRPCELWWPGQGTIESRGATDHVELRLPAYGGVFLRFAAERAPRSTQARAQVHPRLEFTPIGVAAPRVGKGEYVRADVHTVSSEKASRPVWEAEAVLARGEVDTWLFLQFAPARPLNLENSDGVSFDTWVPEQQRTANELLVIVREQGGGEFIARTGRSLGAEGAMRVHVAWSQFELAGWSQDPNGRLDRDRIAAISIGWGGYYGLKNERIVFRTTGPEAARVVIDERSPTDRSL